MIEARYKKVKDDNKWLRQEMLELRVGFAIQNEELEGEYQKQVNDMFFFDYQCCIKKHGITQDTPNYHLNNKDGAVGSPAQGDGDAA